MDFIAALSRGIADLQSAQAQNSSKGAHSSSIAEFNKTLKQAMESLKRFDALVKSTFGNDPGIMAAWKIARHVIQTGTATKAAAASAGAGRELEDRGIVPANGVTVLRLASKHIGEVYVLGARAPKDHSHWRGPWDCAE